jgi:hypothetical protein
VSLHEVVWPVERLVGDRRLLPGASPRHAVDAEVTHQAADGAVCDLDALTLELGVDLVDAIDTAVLLEDPEDLRAQLVVTT